MPAPPRPSIYNLQRFLLGTLPPGEVAAVAAWLDSSPDAARALAGVAAHDALTQAVASTVGVKPPSALLVSRVVANVTGSYVPAVESVPDVNEQTRPSGAAAVRSGAPVGPPERIGPFRVVRELGRGGMGVVYEATDEGLGRRAAVKVLSPELAASPEARQRFLREGRAVADLTPRDHIVTIYQVGEADAVPFLAMEFIEGVTLETWRKTRPGPVTADEVLWVAGDLLAGLAVAHKKKIVHRDMKPANAMIERATRRVKILDFGLTRNTGEGELLTSIGRVLGTPAYMSPEQANGRPVDVRSDLFSVGVTLYALVTGRSPFLRDEMMPTLLAVVTEEVPPLTGLPAPLCTFVARLMSKNPNDRPADAGAALAELRALEGKLKAPVTKAPPKPPPLPPPVPSVTRPAPKPEPAVAIAPSPAAPARSNRTRNRVLIATAAVLLAATAYFVSRGGDKPRSDEVVGEGGTGAAPAPAPVPVPPLGEFATLTAGSVVSATGEIRKGELTEANKAATTYAYMAQTAGGVSRGFNTAYVITYSMSSTVSLKAGQTLAVSATMVGKDRHALLVLIDPTGKAIDGTDLRPRTATVTFHEVSATGRYHLVVGSDRIGDFYLRVSDPSDAGLDPAALEKDLARLKRELAEAETNLKALKTP